MVTHLTVSDQNTALALGSGDVPMLGTPAVLALAEGACASLVADELDRTETTVGVWVELWHKSPSPIGVTVRAAAEVVERDSGRIRFSVAVVDSEGDEVAVVHHQRVIVNRQAFAG